MNNYKIATIVLAAVCLVLLVYQEYNLHQVYNFDGLEIPQQTFNDLMTTSNSRTAILCDIDNDKCMYVENMELG